MKKGIIAVVVIIVLAGGVFALTRNHKNSDNSASTSTQASSTPPPPSSTQNNVAATITYSSSGFSPASITVKSGDKVTLKNTSSSTVQMDSDPHPIHTDDQDLNVGTVEPGQSQTFTVTKKGTFGYHNHLNPSDKGTITVE